MRDYDTAELRELDERLRDQRDDRAVAELVRRVAHADNKARSTAATTLNNLAADHPDRIAPHVDALAHLLTITQRPDPTTESTLPDGRPDLEPTVHKTIIDVLDELLDEHPERFDEVADVLVEEARVPGQVVSDRPQVEEMYGVWKALELWQDAGERGREIPSPVVIDAAESIPHFDVSQRITAVRVLEAAVATDSDGARLAIGVLGTLAAGHDKRMRHHGAESIARLAVETDADLLRPHELADRIEPARSIDLVDEALIDEAVTDLRSRDPVTDDLDDLFDVGYGIDEVAAPDGPLDRLLHVLGVDWR